MLCCALGLPHRPLALRRRPQLQQCTSSPAGGLRRTLAGLGTTAAAARCRGRPPPAPRPASLPVHYRGTEGGRRQAQPSVQLFGKRIRKVQLERNGVGRLMKRGGWAARCTRLITAPTGRLITAPVGPRHPPSCECVTTAGAGQAHRRRCLLLHCWPAPALSSRSQPAPTCPPLSPCSRPPALRTLIRRSKPLTLGCPSGTAQRTRRSRAAVARPHTWRRRWVLPD